MVNFFQPRKQQINPFCIYSPLQVELLGSGGKQTLLGISKRGDTYLRPLLIHGGGAVVRVAHKHQVLLAIRGGPYMSKHKNGWRLRSNPL